MTEARTIELERFHNAGAITSGTLTGYDLTTLFPEMIAQEVKVVNGSGANLVVTSNAKTLPRVAPAAKGIITGPHLTDLFITPDATVNASEVVIIVKGRPSSYTQGSVPA